MSKLFRIRSYGDLKTAKTLRLIKNTKEEDKTNRLEGPVSLSKVEKHQYNPENKLKLPLFACESKTSLGNTIVKPRRRLVKRCRLNQPRTGQTISESIGSNLQFNESQIKSKQDVVSNFRSMPTLRPAEFYKQLVMPFARQQRSRKKVEDDDTLLLTQLLKQLQGSGECS